MNKVFLCYDNTDVGEVVHTRLLELNQYYHFPVAGWRFDSTTHLDDKLIELADRGVDFVVVSALGNYLRLGSINDEIISDSIDNNAPLVGHLLDRRGYYNIDPQFFCLNLQAWTAVGRPRFGAVPGVPGGYRFTSCCVERSKENFHDEYTPYWIRPATGTQTYQVREFEFGTHVVRTFLEHGYRLINVNNNIRNRKVYLYPTDNQKELEQLFKDWTFNPTVIPLQKYAGHIRGLFADDLRTVYVLNSEPVLITTPRKIDHYVGVCGGLKAVAVLNSQGFDADTRVSLFDISKPALDYQRYLVANWDGNFADYQQVFDQYQKQHSDLIYAWRSWNTWDTEVSAFLTSARMTAADFQSAWQQYCQLTIDYTLLDLHDTEQVDTFVNTLQGNVYMWVSNAYNMEHTIARYGLSWLKSRSDALIVALKQHSGSVCLEKENRILQIR